MPVRISTDTPPPHIPDPFVSRNAYRLPPHSPMSLRFVIHTRSQRLHHPLSTPIFHHYPPNFHLPLLPSLFPSSSASIAYIYFHIYASNPHRDIASFPECIDDAYSWRCISISLHLLPLPPPRSLSYSFAITHPSTTLPRQECRRALSLRSYYNMGLLQNHELTYHDCEYVFMSRERVGRSAYYRVFIFCQS